MPAVPYTSLFCMNQLACFGNNILSNPNPGGHNTVTLVMPVNVLQFNASIRVIKSTYRNLINYGNTSLSLIFLKSYCYIALFSTRPQFHHHNNGSLVQSREWPKRHLANGYETDYTIWSLSHGGGSLWAQISEGRRHRPPTTVGVRKLEWLPFHMVSKYLQSII